MTAEAEKRLTYVGVCAVLAAVTVAAYWPVRHHGFLNYDDQEIYDNPRLTSGLTVENVGWAFATSEHANWFPLTRLSWMTDWAIFRDDSQPHHDWAGGHHLVSVGIHAASGIILLLVLAWMTGRLWPSAAVAALFLLHPLHIQSVAWAIERKDTLSGLFWMLGLASYAWYVRRPSLGRYGLVFAALALGLMAKAMVVTLPLVLLLLDFWPLKRLRIFAAQAGSVPLGPEGRQGSPLLSRRARKRAAAGAAGTTGPAADPTPQLPAVTLARALLEKAPLLVLAAASSAWTFYVQHSAGAVSTSALYSQALLCENALLSYVRYLGLTFWPHGLAIFYPFPEAIPAWEAAGAAAVLVAVTALAIRLARGRPYLAVGWFWYLVTLVPVIGLVQAGSQAMADRYTYLPLIGIFIMAAWGLDDLAGRWRVGRAAGLAALAAVAALTVATRSELAYWATSETINRRALEATGDGNWLAHYNLASVLTERDGPGDNDEAIDHLRKAIRGKADDPDAFNSLGRALVRRGAPGDAREAFLDFQEALKLNPNHAKAHNNFANLLKVLGDPGEAIKHYQAAIRKDPGYAEAHNNYANLLAQLGRPDDAIREYREAIRINPDLAEPHNNLATVLADHGEFDEAIQQCREAIRLKPGFPEAHHNLAGVLAARGRLAEAIREYRATIGLRPDWAMARGELAWLLATGPDPNLRNGREAVRLAEELCLLTDRKDLRFLDLLAAAYGEAGMFREAAATAREAIALADAQGRPREAADIQARLMLYEAGRPFHVEDGPRD